MSRSNLPQSDADRIAAATTAVAVAVIVSVILAVFPDPRDISFVAAHTMLARHVDEGNNATTNAAVSPSSRASLGTPVKSRGTL
jgi:hypothetical protein